jgi:hypothetical protein
MADSYISSLLKEEVGGTRIYHVILADYILSNVSEPDRTGYIERASRAVFDSKVMGFFEKARFIDFLINSGRVSKRIADALHKGFAKDESLACYFYERNDYKDVPGTGWIKFLREAGEFDDLDGVKDKVSNTQWLKAKYLGRVAGKVPEDVFSIISRVKPEDQSLQGFIIEAIANMPNKWIKKGIPIVKEFLDKREYLIWYSVGERSAKLMERILSVNNDMVYEIADLLLDVWMPEAGKKKWSFENIKAKFTPYEYNDLMFKYYRKVWEKEPNRAAIQLVEIFNRYLNELNKNVGLDASEHFYITIENLEQPDRLERDYEAIIVEGICQSGKEIIQKEPTKTEGFLDYLRRLDKVIFTRIEMYLLRFVKGDKYNERINEIIGDYDSFSIPGFKCEYNLLLREKIEVITEKIKEKYVGSIENVKVDDLKDFAEWFKRTRGREYKPEDLEKYESGMRARKLFLVKDVEDFSILYNKYKGLSGYSDDDLKPSPMIGEARDVSQSEESPKTKEELLEMSVKEVLRFVSNPENYSLSVRISTGGQGKTG